MNNSPLKNFVTRACELFASSNLGIWVFNPKTGEFVTDNTLKNWLGVSEFDTFESFRSLIHPLDGFFVEAHDAEIAAMPNGARFENYRAIKTDGSVVWLKETCNIISEGEERLIVASCVNSTELNEVAAERDKLEAVSRVVGVNGFSVSPKTNEFAFDSDYSSELSRELTGMNGSLENLRKLIYPDDYEVFLEQRKEFEKFGAVPFSRRLRIINPDGSYSWVLIRSAVIDRDEFGTPTLIRGALLLLDNATIAEEEQKYIPIISQDSYTREEEKLGSILFSNSPFMSGLFSSDFKPIYFNPTFLKYLGSSNLKESINNFSDIISKRIPAFQPSGARSVPLEDRLMATAKYGHAEFETVLITNTGLTAFSCVMKKITIDDSFIIGVYLSNVQKLKDVEHEILKKDKLLRAINKIVPNILNADQKAFNKELVASLRILGLTINVGRVYMFENLKINGVLHAKKVCEWSTFVSERKDQSKEITICYENFEPVNACLSEKKIYAGASPLMLGRDRKAVYSLIIPLYYRGMSWGFIGFDDCRENHFFSDTERQLLVSGGGFLMGAILRNKTFSEAVAAREMLEAREYMLKEVNKTCMTLFAAGGINNLRSVLPSALKMLAQAMKTARLSIWRNKEKDGTIFTERVFTWRDENLFIESDYPISVSLEIPACINGESFYEINDSINSLAERIKELYTINAPDGSAFIGTLVLNGKFWGFVSYLFLEPERRLDDSEKSLFIQAGLMAAISMSLAETTEGLIEAREKAIESTRAKSEFLSRMSHEIRTPMNAIFGMITLAQKTADIRKMQYYLDKVNVSSHQLLSIINDVLDMSKIEANKLEISPIPFTLTKTIENAINITQLKSSEKKQNLNYKINDPFNKKLVSDELRISQVLINLLSNAVKFTPVNGSIFVNVSLAEESGTVFLILEVADTGVGIPEDSLDKIFNAFEQSDGSVTRKYGGTGLGLAICKKIAELMNGEISVSSKVEEGSVFKFRIPVELGSAVMIEEQQKGMSLRSMGAMSVLVVDDVSDTLLYMQRIIGEICAKCDTAVSVTEAVVKIKKSVRNKSPYDIIIIDWYLENETAADVLQRTRNLLNEETIIVLSSIADFADIKQQVQELGHVHFLKKPVFPEDIYEKIRHAASSVKTEDSESHPNWNGKCILLAEDIEINREIVASLLEETEVAFEFAENGAEAVDKFKEMPEKFDLILMDMQMPVMDGITATKTIRKMSGKGKEIPIVAMTANAFKEDAQLCLEAGMNGHIPKPLEIETIYEVISKFMKTND